MLNANGVPVSDANRYMAHFLGAGGAVRLVKAMDAAPNAPAAALFPAAASANPAIFYKSSSGGSRTARSLAEVYDLQTRRFAPEPQPHLDPQAGDPADPRFAALSGPERIQLYNETIAAKRQAQATAQARLGPQLDTLTQDLRTTGRPINAAVPSRQNFTEAFGEANGTLRYRAIQDAITKAPALAALRYRLDQPPADDWQASYPTDGNGNAVPNAQDHGAQAQKLEMQQRLAELKQERQKDPVAFLAAGHPELASLWQQAETTGDPGDLAAAIRTTAALADKDGVPPEERRFLSQPMLAQFMQGFGDTAKPVKQRLAPLA